MKPVPKRPRRATEGLAAPSADPPQGTFWPSPTPAPTGQDSETPLPGAQSSDTEHKAEEGSSSDLNSPDLHSTEPVDAESKVTEATTRDSVDVQPNVTGPKVTEQASPEPRSSELVDSDQDGERRRDPDQVREALLSMIAPVWVVDRAEPQHDPSVALARLVDLRDQRCCGPGCSISVGRTQRDHSLRWPDGPTAAWNLSVKSARCHRAKHTGWQVTIDNAGTAHWVSPLGRAYGRPGVWEPPPDLSAVRTLPAPRAAQQLPYQQNPPDEVTGWTAPQPTGSTPSGQFTRKSQDHQSSDDRAAENHPSDEEPPF